MVVVVVVMVVVVEVVVVVHSAVAYGTITYAHPHEVTRKVSLWLLTLCPQDMGMASNTIRISPDHRRVISNGAVSQVT